MRSMLGAMNSPTERAAEAWKSLGTSMFDAQGNMRDFDTVLNDVRIGLEGMTDAQRTQTIQAIAGMEGMQAFTALLNSEGIEGMTEEMREQATVAEMAEKMMNTLKGVIDDFGGSVESLMVTALKPFVEDTLKPLILYVKDTINQITDWAEVNPELTQTIVKFLAAAVAIGPVLFVAGKAITLVGIAISALTSPIGLVVAGIGALAVAFEKDFGGIKTFIMPILDRVWESINLIRDAMHFLAGDIQHLGLTDALKNFLGIGEIIYEDGSTGSVNLANNAGSLEGLLSQMGMSPENASAVVDFIVNTFNSIRDTIRSVIDTLRPLFAEIGEFLGNIFQNVDFGQLFEIGRTLLSLTNPIGILTTALRALGVDIGQVFRDGVAALTRFLDAINNGGTVFDGLRAAFGDSTFIDGLETGLNTIVTFVNDTVIPALESLSNWFTQDALPGALSFVQNEVIPRIEDFIGVLQRIWEDVSPFLSDLFNWFVFTGLPIIAGIVRLVVQPVIEGFINIMSGIWEAVKPALETLYDWFITSGLPKIKEFIEGPFTTVLENIRDFLSGFWEWVKPGLEALKNGLEEIFGFITDHILPPVLDSLDNLLDKFNEIATMFANGEIPGAQQIDVGLNTGSVEDVLAGAEDLYNSINNNPFINPLGALVNAVNATVMPRDQGGPGIAGMPYLIRPKAGPELFVPSTNGQFIPNFDQFLQQRGQGDVNLHGDIIVQGASSYEAGLDAGRGVGDGVKERLRSRGRGRGY